MTTNKIRVAINGFGRIGRTITRQIMSATCDTNFEIVHINDIAPLDTCSYLLQFDSIYGPFFGSISTDRHSLRVRGQAIPFTHYRDIYALDLQNTEG